MISTELINNILTSEEGKKIVRHHVSPIYGNSYIGLWLFQIIGTELDHMNNWCKDIMLQTSPYTATWSMYLWEMEYGIDRDDSLSIEQRRNTLLNKMRYKAPINPQKMADLITSTLGVPVDIIENTGKNKFSVYVRKNVDASAVNEVISVLNSAKPAHLIYDINVAENRDVNVCFYGGVSAEVQKKYRLEV